MSNTIATERIASRSGTFHMTLPYWNVRQDFRRCELRSTARDGGGGIIWTRRFVCSDGFSELPQPIPVRATCHAVTHSHAILHYLSHTCARLHVGD